MEQIDITFPCNDGHPMRGVLTLPAGSSSSAPRPGLILIYEILGLNEEMRRVARDLAAEGYAVLIPDVFDRGLKFVCVAGAIRSMMKGEGQLIDDLEAGRRYLASRPEVDGERLGVVGFCMGGGFALLLAMSGRYQVAAPFYGQVPDEMPLSCPVVASYGGKDKPLIGAAEKLRGHLERLGVDHDIKTYEDAGHSFFTRPIGFVATKIGPMLPMHVAHHEGAANDSRERMLAFLKKHLG
ncbi:dienelactone hydrolase family protein [Polyangium aurulentum]|uniref:dienelactone hydrolase family protein n=1 Tax=Polyangium aurulentum TaxID=2567896 RepID=UPI0010AEB803|nr:dienelactone hydrolase family protein [Polyangium aurulentum]UQA60932.1 dienelactone hydrolase family protein [Polyangium aurulentum]